MRFWGPQDGNRRPLKKGDAEHLPLRRISSTMVRWYRQAILKGSLYPSRELRR